MHNKIIKKALIVTGYKCNNNCIFCNIEPAKRSFNRSNPDILVDLKKEYLKGCRVVEFIGGEVTIREDIIFLISYARNLGFNKISIETNGRMFSDMNFTNRIIEAGLTNVLFSIHGHSEKVHDLLTNVPGSYMQAFMGLVNVLNSRKLIVTTNFVINKLNFEFISQFLLSFKGFKISTFHFAFIHSQGSALNNFKMLVPKLTDVLPFVLNALKKFKNLPLKILNIPPCLLINHRNNILSSHEKVYCYVNSEKQHSVSLFTELSNLKTKTNKCMFCKLFSTCDGIWKDYYKFFGEKELKPVLK